MKQEASTVRWTLISVGFKHAGAIFSLPALTPKGVWSTDQNEALQRYRISSFVIIDGTYRRATYQCYIEMGTMTPHKGPFFHPGISMCPLSAFSRNPIHYELTTGLSGGDHTRFYCNALERMLKAPECVSVDMTGQFLFWSHEPRASFFKNFCDCSCVDCWNGVKVITRAIYGNNDAVPFEVGGVHLSARHFHQTLSKKNTPVGIMLCVYKIHPLSPLPRRGVACLALSVQVERHWREWNPMLVRFYERFHALEVEGILDPRCVKDLFCLHRVFLPEIQNVMDRHYTSLRMQKKTKSTRNPNYPAGESS